MKKIAFVLSTSIILAACGLDNEDEKKDSNIKIENTEKSDKKEVVSKKDTQEKSIEEKKQEEESNKEGNVTKVNGVLHYNYPSILDEDFKNSLLDNTFNIESFGVRQKSEKDPYSLEKDEQNSHEGIVVFDNFTFNLNAGTGESPEFPLYSLELNALESQGVKIEELMQKWGVNEAFADGSSKIVNGNNTNTHLKIVFNPDTRIIKQIIINDGEFSEGISQDEIDALEDKDNLSITKDEILTFEFGQKVLSNSMNLAGYINVGTEVTTADIVEGIGNPDEQDGERYKYSNLEVLKGDIDIYEILIDTTGMGIDIEELRNVWAKESIKETEPGRQTSHTYYDAIKDNGFYVEVIDDGREVTYIRIQTDKYPTYEYVRNLK